MALGALAFFAVPYTILVYPILFVFYPRLWNVCRKHGYITSGDFVRGRFGNRWLALAVTVTGIVATMPYIALQLVGIQVVIGAMGVSGSGWAADLPLLIAFVVLAAFTYSSGLRAPASIAIVKDILIYITAFAAIIVVPMQLGGFGKIFAAVPASKLLLTPPGPGTTGSYGAYATLALGSALALFLYPHSLTGVLSANSSQAIRRNAAMLPAYSLMLGMLALLGFFAIAAGVGSAPEFATGFKLFGNNFSVPALFLHSFPAWFVGVAFAAIGIGALVPAAIMSIAAANLYTRNIHREFINRNPTDKQEATMAKLVSLIVKVGALVFIVFVPTKYAVQLQLLGGIWIIQTLPAILFGIYTRWFNSWALLLGWAVGTCVGTWMAFAVNLANTYPLTDRRPYIPRIYSVLHGYLELDYHYGADACIQCDERSPATGRRDGCGRLPGLSARAGHGVAPAHELPCSEGGIQLRLAAQLAVPQRCDFLQRRKHAAPNRGQAGSSEGG
jgi:SSS family solute:Na+ symporter